MFEKFFAKKVLTMVLINDTIFFAPAQKAKLFDAAGNAFRTLKIG